MPAAIAGEIKMGGGDGGLALTKHQSREVLVLAIVTIIAFLLRGNQRAIGKHLNFVEYTLFLEGWSVLFWDLGKEEFDKL